MWNYYFTSHTKFKTKTQTMNEFTYFDVMNLHLNLYADHITLMLMAVLVMSTHILCLSHLHACYYFHYYLKNSIFICVIWVKIKNEIT